VLFPVVGTAAILVAGLFPNRGVTALLGLRLPVWVGDVSYGWYLWHWPLIVFASALWPDTGWVLAVAAIASLAPTWLSYRFVERPIRFNNGLTGRRMVAMVAACIVLPVVACLGLLFANRIEARTDAVKSLDVALAPHADSTKGCDSPTPIGQRTGDECTWKVKDARGTIFLVGDSNAGHFSESMADSSARAGYELTISTLSACPFVDAVVTGPQIDGEKCHQFVADSVAALKERRPALVVIASSSTHYFNNSAYQFRDPRTGAIGTTPAAKAPIWEGGIASVLRQLVEAGIPAMVVHTVPHPNQDVPNWGPATCPAVRVFTDSCGYAIGRDLVEQQQRPAREAEKVAVGKVPGATSADFTDDLCAADVCATTRDGRWLYMDGDHISVEGARTLTDRFRQLIDDHARSSG